MARPIKKGSTDQSTEILIIDNTTGLPETAVEHNTTGINLWYRRLGGLKVSITEVALVALDSAHSDGGIEHIGNGKYRLDLPDAAFAAGVNGVSVGGTVTGMIVIGNEHALVDYDPYDAVHNAEAVKTVIEAAGSHLALIKAITDWQRSCSGTVVVVNPGTDTIFDLTAVIGTLSTDDDEHNNMEISFLDVSGSVKTTRKVNDLDGVNGRVTVDEPLQFPIQDGVDTFILWNRYSPTAAAGGGATAEEVHKYDVTGINTPGQAGYEFRQSGSHLSK